MGTNIDELRFVADLAQNGGMMKAQIEQLESENARLKSDNEALKDENARLRAKNEELKSAKQNGPTYVVNNFFLLSVPKTFKYVSALDNDERRFVGHFMHQTLEDGTPQSVFAQVDEMTQLEGNQEERLADAMEELAKKPTTQNIYGDKNDFNDDAEMLKLTLPADADPAEIAMRITELQKQIEDKKKK